MHVNEVLADCKKADFIKVPERATFLSAGYDIFAPNDITLEKGNVYTIDTGITLEDTDTPIQHVLIFDEKGKGKKCIISPIEYTLICLPRSSYGSKYGMSFVNTASVIDGDYRDSIKLFVQVEKKLNVKAGDKIAQFIILPFCLFVDEKHPTKKRDGGIGSTGR